MNPTDIKDPEYFHKIVDCQYACPSHTPVPEYIRLIAAGQYTEAYMVNWESNVFPGILGRTCDRPCEPACRRNRIEKNEEPVAICRLKRVCADNKGEVKPLMPIIPKKKNGKRIALIGGGPASLTVARDLMPLGYECVLYDNQKKAGGMMRSEIPSFRLPEKVLDEEVGYILDMGVECHFGVWIKSIKKLLENNFDAIFVGTGATRGRDLDIPGRKEADTQIHIGLDWLAGVAFAHTSKIGKRVIVLGGGNTAMDCCRTARRLGGEDVRVIVRSPIKDIKSSSWERKDALTEDIPIFENHVPVEFKVTNGKLTGVIFEKIRAIYDDNGKRSLLPTGEAHALMECDDVLIAIGQDNSFPWIERDIGISFSKWELPVLNRKTLQSTLPKVFFGGDAAFGPKNIITAVAHGHQAAISIDLFCHDKDIVNDRPPPMTTLLSQKMSVHEWIYSNDVSDADRYAVPHIDKVKTLKDIKLEVELGFDVKTAYSEAMRCLNCDVQTIFTTEKCIECDACSDICPMNCITFTKNGIEKDLRLRLNATSNNLKQALYISDKLPTHRVMVKDEDVCLHCGLCAERCPTAAWDMQKFLYISPKTTYLTSKETKKNETA
ncbi:MAG: FAD-dependent oxidoreductase [Alphaproteobacteria bacterium]|nr:FAD-dependent oxidoreductase [Alphaproteobacteria bacterium]